LQPFWVKAYLGLGANLPLDRSPDAMLCEACRRLAKCESVRVSRCSSLYRSKPWGELEQPDFYNAVVEIETLLAPRDLLHMVKSLERELGRTPTYRWGPRVIDIDILLYDVVEVNDPDLVIPHRHLHVRPFAYVPLLEIAPEVRLPSGKKLADVVALEIAEEGTIEKLGALDWQTR
jgi:2-amino-4-hydroxy-6-hydroxymethyldihydropteridine diphosphokinase